VIIDHTETAFNELCKSTGILARGLEKDIFTLAEVKEAEARAQRALDELRTAIREWDNGVAR
jgi:hypothetical protein